MADGCFGAFFRFHEEKEFRDRTVAFFQEKAGLRMTTSRPFGGAGNFALPATARQGKLLFAGEAVGFQDALWGFGMRKASENAYGLVLRRLGQESDTREWLRRLYMPRVWKTLASPIARRVIRSKRRAPACVKEGRDCTWCHCRHEPAAQH